MNTRNGFAFFCLAVPALVELGLGVVYFTAPQIMSYHQQALGTTWSDLSPGVRQLLLTLLHGYGSAHFAVGVALSTLLVVPWRRGQAWARWAILAVGLPVLAATAYLSFRLAAVTAASVPWQGAVLLLLLFLLGVALPPPHSGPTRQPPLSAAQTAPLPRHQ